MNYFPGFFKYRIPGFQILIRINFTYRILQFLGVSDFISVKFVPS